MIGSHPRSHFHSTFLSPQRPHILAQNTLSMCCPGKISFEPLRRSCPITTDPPTTPLISAKFGFFQMLVRRLWEGPWWFCLIEKWSLMLLLVVWECQGLTLVDLKQLPFDHRTTQRQNSTFTFLWDNDWTSAAPIALFWVVFNWGPCSFGTTTSTHINWGKISFGPIAWSWQLTPDPPNHQQPTFNFSWNNDRANSGPTPLFWVIFNWGPCSFGTTPPIHINWGKISFGPIAWSW